MPNENDFSLLVYHFTQTLGEVQPIVTMKNLANAKKISLKSINIDL